MAEPSEKSLSAYRTIGEVSAELGLPPHVLRFWESKFTQIKPQKRRGGHRYYRPQDVETVKEIKALLHHQGLTIKGAQKYLKDKKSGAADPALIPENSRDVVIQAGLYQTLLRELKEVRQLLDDA